MNRPALALLAALAGPSVDQTAFAQNARCDANGVCSKELPSESPVIPAPAIVSPRPADLGHPMGRQAPMILTPANVPPVPLPTLPFPSRVVICHTTIGYCDWTAQVGRYGGPCACQDAGGQIHGGTIQAGPRRTR